MWITQYENNNDDYCYEIMTMMDILYDKPVEVEIIHNDLIYKHNIDINLIIYQGNVIITPDKIFMNRI